jgi:hypothetical protein
MEVEMSKIDWERDGFDMLGYGEHGEPICIEVKGNGIWITAQVKVDAFIVTDVDTAKYKDIVEKAVLGLNDYFKYSIKEYSRDKSE